MRRSEFLELLQEQLPTRTPEEVEGIFNLIFEEITKALEEGGRVELRGFGTFFAKRREARKGCDPRTGDEIEIGERYVPFFRAGKHLLVLLNR